jgi:hypothetical protein
MNLQDILKDAAEVDKSIDPAIIQQAREIQEYFEVEAVPQSYLAIENVLHELNVAVTLWDSVKTLQDTKDYDADSLQQTAMFVKRYNDIVDSEDKIDNSMGALFKTAAGLSKFYLAIQNAIKKLVQKVQDFINDFFNLNKRKIKKVDELIKTLKGKDMPEATSVVFESRATVLVTYFPDKKGTDLILPDEVQGFLDQILNMRLDSIHKKAAETMNPDESLGASFEDLIFNIAKQAGSYYHALKGDITYIAIKPDTGLRFVIDKDMKTKKFDFRIVDPTDRTVHGARHWFQYKTQDVIKMAESASKIYDLIETFNKLDVAGDINKILKNKGLKNQPEAAVKAAAENARAYVKFITRFLRYLMKIADAATSLSATFIAQLNRRKELDEYHKKQAEESGE